jgi:hypothetical protein
VLLTGELHTMHDHNSNPLRQKRTEVTQVRRHDAPCGVPFFILKTVTSVLAWQIGVQKVLLPTISESWKKRHHHHHQSLPSIPRPTNQKHLANMHLPTTTLSLLITSTTALSTQEVWNWCADPFYLVNVNSTGSTTGPLKIAPGGGDWTTPITGVGNSLGVSINDQFWSSNTSKLVWGSSTDAGILYWTVSNVNGDPFAAAGQKWEVSSWEGNRCENATA